MKGEEGTHNTVPVSANLTGSIVTVDRLASYAGRGKGKEQERAVHVCLYDTAKRHGDWNPWSVFHVNPHLDGMGIPARFGLRFPIQWYSK